MKTGEQVVVHYDRKGETTKGDVQFTLDTSEAPVKTWPLDDPKSKNLFIEVFSADGIAVRDCIRRNIYVNASDARGVSRIPVVVAMGTVERKVEATPATPAGSAHPGEIDPITMALMKSGDAEALAQHLKATAGFAIAAARTVASALIATVAE